MDKDSDINIKGGEVSPDKGAKNNMENGKAAQLLERILDKVKKILERNRMLIREISQNQEAGEDGGHNRNSALICEIQNNMDYVANLYTNLSASFSLSLVEGSPVAVDGPNGGNKEAIAPGVEKTN